MPSRTALLIAGLFVAALPSPAPALADPPTQASTAGDTRATADRVLAFLQSGDGAEALFTEDFRTAIPLPQIVQLRRGMIDALGAPKAFDSWTDGGNGTGYGLLRFERGQLRVELRHELTPPHRISELLFKPAAPSPGDDTPGKLLADAATLPGQMALSGWRLDGAAPVRLFGSADTPALPIGSVFKLWVLAELDAQVRRGQRRWSDVVRLDRKSIPSGMIQDWPDGAPLTLHSLATLMISISDNSATDLLIDTLGRDRIARRAERWGWVDTARTGPMLKTVEMAALKSPAQRDLADLWERGDVAARRALLKQHGARVTAASVDVGALSGNPVRSGSIEWFADAPMLARMGHWLVHEASAETRAILSVNPGFVPRDGWHWTGYKGGSEPGVLAALQLFCDADDICYAVTGQWHDPAAPVNLTRFSDLLNRAAALLNAPQ